MRHRIRRLGVCHRHLVPTAVYSSYNALAIPAWGTGPLQTPTKIDNLKRFCNANQFYSKRITRQRIRKAEAKAATRIVPFFVFGTSVYLSAHTFLASPDTGNQVVHRNSGTLYSEAVQVPHLAHLSISEDTAGNPIQNAAADLLKNPKTTERHKFTKGFTTPAAGFAITSNFGSRIHPIFGNQRFHHGVDIATPNGTPIKASKAGFVTFADWEGGYGKKVLIDHGDGYETLYAHLDEILVKTGEFVTQKEVIGLSGSTGYVTGPHLHFEIRLYRVAHNPLDYL